MPPTVPRPKPYPFTVGCSKPGDVSTNDGARTGNGGKLGGEPPGLESRCGVRVFGGLRGGDEWLTLAEASAAAAFSSLPDESPPFCVTTV